MLKPRAPFAKRGRRGSHHARTNTRSLRLEAGLSDRRQCLRFGRMPGLARQTEEDHAAHSGLRQVNTHGRDVRVPTSLSIPKGTDTRAPLAKSWSSSGATMRPDGPA